MLRGSEKSGRHRHHANVNQLANILAVLLPLAHQHCQRDGFLGNTSCAHDFGDDLRSHRDGLLSGSVIHESTQSQWCQR